MDGEEVGGGGEERTRRALGAWCSILSMEGVRGW